MFTVTDEADVVVGAFETMVDVRAWVQGQMAALASPKLVERIGEDRQQQFIVRLGKIGTVESLLGSPVFFVKGEWMKTKLIVRVLNDDGVLLGWAEFLAEARGDGKLWAVEPVNVAFTVDGLPARISLHWVDVNVEILKGLTAPAVLKGQILRVLNPGPVLTVGPMATGLEPVTVGNTVVGVPVGSTAAMATV